MKAKTVLAQERGECPCCGSQDTILLFENEERRQDHECQYCLATWTVRLRVASVRITKKGYPRRES